MYLPYQALHPYRNQETLAVVFWLCRNMGLGCTEKNLSDCKASISLFCLHSASLPSPLFSCSSYYCFPEALSLLIRSSSHLFPFLAFLLHNSFPCHCLAVLHMVSCSLLWTEAINQVVVRKPHRGTICRGTEPGPQRGGAELLTKEGGMDAYVQ